MNHLIDGLFILIWWICIFALIRNWFVYKTIMRILKKDSKDEQWKIFNIPDYQFKGHLNYAKLPSYNKMMFQFWKWKY